MGIGAAVGGLAKGLAGGMKLKSELDDAEERRGLMGLQRKAAQQQIDEQDEKAAARSEAAGFIKGYAEGNTDLGFVRNEDGSYDPNLPANVARNYDLQEQSARRVALAYGQSPTKAAAEVRTLRKEGFQEGVNTAAQLYGMGDLAGGDAALSKVYPLIRDGRTFLGSQVDPNDPKKIALRYRLDKTGEESSMSTTLDEVSKRLLPLAMNLTDAANFNLNSQRVDIDRERVGIEKEGLSLRRDEFASLKSHRDWTQRFEETKWNDGRGMREAQINYYNNMGRAAVARASADLSAADLARTTQALNNQLGSVTTLLGIPKNFDPATASKEEIDNHNLKLGIASNAMYLISNGMKGGKLTMDAPTAIRIAQAAENVPFKDIKSAGSGIYYTTIQGVTVPLSITETQYKALERMNSETSNPATPSAARRGIKVPDGVVGPEAGFGMGMAP